MAKFPKIVVIHDLSNTDNTTVCTTALGTKTDGDPDVTNPPVKDTDIYKEANDALAVQTQRQTNQSKSLTSQSNELTDIVRVSYSSNAAYIEQIANKVVRTTGSYDAGLNVVQRCGYKVKTKGELHPRSFEVVASGPGWFHLRVKAVGRRAGYLWRLGITTEKGVMPTQFLPIFFTVECEVVIINLESGSIYGLQSASILPVAQTKNSDPSQTLSSKTATVSVSTKANKATFSAGDDPYQWSDFIYEVCP
jgi:hypothetical protein